MCPPFRLIDLKSLFLFASRYGSGKGVSDEQVEADAFFLSSVYQGLVQRAGQANGELAAVFAVISFSGR